MTLEKIKKLFLGCLLPMLIIMALDFALGLELKILPLCFANRNESDFMTQGIHLYLYYTVYTL